MKQLGVLFGDTQPLRADDLSDTLNVGKSAVMRAAMQIGLAKLESVSSKNIDDAKMLIILEDAKGRQ